MQLYSDKSLYDSLKELEIIPEDLLDDIFDQSQKDNDSLYNLLLRKNVISDENLGKVVADLIELPFVKLTESNIDQHVLHLFPESFAIAQRIVVFGQNEQTFQVATSHPENTYAINLTKTKLGNNIRLFFTTDSQLDQTLLLYKQDIGQVFEEIIKKNAQKAKGSESTEPPIIKIVDTILTFAYQKNASDIHIEALEEKTLVRFRIDGILHDMVSLPSEIHDRVVTRIKVLAKLRTDEHQAPQDGKLTYDVLESSSELKKTHSTHSDRLDLRVSIVPSTDGEKVVMRLLAEQNKKLSLEELGFASRDLDTIKEAYSKSHGMLLTTGPTGSGKTTTMYSVLKLLNTRGVNISTIEDPVEYNIEGITQIQVNKKTDLSFANGLRSLVRQDPDIILVGEIRDEETADIAINAAMTGHLVLSTLHTNDAATAIPRLIDMGVEPFLIASTINAVIAQRLVRKVHLKCRVSHEVSREDLIKQFGERTAQHIIGDKKMLRGYKGAGCEICNNTGYEDRIGLYEVLVLDDDIRQSIVERKDAGVIKDIAIKNGMTTMVDDGLEKVKNGLTSIDEVIRVIQEK